MQRVAQRERSLAYGWVVVAASLVLLVGSFGTQLCFGVFLKPLTDEFGWSRAAASGAMSLLMGISGLIGVFMGRLTDRYNVRLVIGVGMVVGAACYFLLATTHSLWQFYLYFGLGGGVSIGSTYTPVNATISKWFRERRALALGTALMGIGVGQMVLSPLAARLIIANGWRTAYVVLGAIVFVCSLPALIVMGRSIPPVPTGAGAEARGEGRAPSPQDAVAARAMTTREAARTAPFWMMMITGVVVSAGFYTVAAHIVSAAIDTGISATTAALILTVSSIGGLPGTVGAWWVSQKLGNKGALLLLIAGEALGIFLFIPTRSVWAFYVVGVLFGFCFAAASPVRQAMAPPLFGLKAIGSVLGFAYLAWSVGGVAGPFLAGFIFDRTGSYDLAFLVVGLLLLVGVASVHFWGSHKEKPAAG